MWLLRGAGGLRARGAGCGRFTSQEISSYRAGSRQQRMRTIGEILGDKTCRLVVQSVPSMPTTRRVGRGRRSLDADRPAVVRVTALAADNIGRTGRLTNYRSSSNQPGQIYDGGSACQMRINALGHHTRIAHPRDALERDGNVAKSHEFYSATDAVLRGLAICGRNG
jgi:hypothetical protein